MRTLGRYIITLSLLMVLAAHAAGAERISLAGTVQALACTQVCGSCCGTHAITDTSGNLTLQVGNAFTDLATIADDGAVHRFSGYYYDTAGQCGVNVCSLFAVEKIDEIVAPAAIYQSAQGKLSIQAVVIDDNADVSYAVTLEAPFAVASVQENTSIQTIPQGSDCSANGAVCSNGTQCIAYFGIAGPSGPEFKTCEIPCVHPGSSCPLGQSCISIADGPGQVCAVD